MTELRTGPHHKPTAPARRRTRLAVAGALAVAAFTAGCAQINAVSDQGTAHPANPAEVTTATVTRIVDGDTVELADGNTIRVIGIDTPERGECGYSEATAALEDLIGDTAVTLQEGAAEPTDRYGRLLRYIAIGDTDAGLTLIEDGFANARYDSRDGYGAHPRETTYVAADTAATHRCANQNTAGAPTTTAPAATDSGAAEPTRYNSCADAKAAGHGPYERGSVEYDWYNDGDGDGLTCE